MRLLREESDKALGQSDEVTESGTNLLAQYDSIGADLRGLIQEWEEGRAALAMNLDKGDHMRSLSSPSNTLPASPTLSGTTAVGGAVHRTLCKPAMEFRNFLDHDPVPQPAARAKRSSKLSRYHGSGARSQERRELLR